MELRLKIGLAGVLVYLIYMLLMGKKERAAENLNDRLESIRNADKNAFGREEELSKPLSERLFRPALRRMVRTVSGLIPISKKEQEQLNESLRSAGIKKNAREYLAELTVAFLITAVAAVIIFRLVMDKSIAQTVPILLFVLMCYYTAARFLLKKKIAQRIERIEGDMPEILDLLSVSVSAGLGFDQALSYVVERCKGELAEELAVTQREIQLGKGRTAALKDLAERGKAESLRMFVSAVTQADTLGIAISNILEVQAENARMQHKQRVEEKAAKLPVKVLIPLVFCIFPVMFIILLGPAVPRVMSAFG